MIFDEYLLKSTNDEMFDSDKHVKKHWRGVSEALGNIGFDKLQEKLLELEWTLGDNGVTYNLYDKIDGNSSRVWSIDPIPFVICESEWSEIKKGVKQRAKLLNLILRDLYGEQKLIKDGIVPAEVIFSHKGFLPQIAGFGESESFNLYFYATDLARGPDGKMWVLGDRAEAPSGLGYAIENRLAMNSVAKELYPSVETKKLFYFLDEFKTLLKSFNKDENSINALLTPGPYNETYFEHSYLSSFLDIKLVQGADLLCKDGTLWLKNLGGLKKIETLLRRVDDKYCDPLELKNDSKLGVAGLVDVLRKENLAMINPLGSGILENVGLNPFMEKICNYFLGETLLLPQIATWWCGQKNQLEFVLQNLQTLIVKKIDKTDDLQVYFCSKLSDTELENLKNLILDTPYKYVAQEKISFSTTPYYNNNSIEPRSATIRSFCLKTKDGYYVMNGGLVRVSAQKNTLLVSTQKGGTSKDLWVLGSDEFDENKLHPHPQNFTQTSLGDLSTQKAETLFWLGRYLCRTITTMRFSLHLLKKISNEKDSQDILQKALTHLTMTYPGFLVNSSLYALDEILDVIKNSQRVGSLSFTFHMLSGANMNLKDILTIESSKLFSRLQGEWNTFVSKNRSTNILLSGELEKMLVPLLAYKELVKESIYKEQGLTLFEIGFKVESALLLTSLLRSIACQRVEKSTEHETLEGLLNALESYNAYRIKYKSSLIQKNIVEFLVFDKEFPKSLLCMTKEILNELKTLPKLMQNNSSIQKASDFLDSLNITDLLYISSEESVYLNLDSVLATLLQLYIECSNELSHTYFSHYGE